MNNLERSSEKKIAGGEMLERTPRLEYLREAELVRATKDVEWRGGFRNRAEEILLRASLIKILQQKELLSRRNPNLVKGLTLKEIEQGIKGNFSNLYRLFTRLTGEEIELYFNSLVDYLKDLQGGTPEAFGKVIYFIVAEENRQEKLPPNQHVPFKIKELALDKVESQLVHLQKESGRAGESNREKAQREANVLVWSSGHFVSRLRGVEGEERENLSNRALEQLQSLAKDPNEFLRQPALIQLNNLGNPHLTR